MSRALKLSDIPLALRRQIKKAAAKQGKELTPEQIIRRAKLEKQREEARKRAAEFKRLCAEAGLPLPAQEFKFAAPERKWSADFAWPEEKVLLEVEGGAWSGGRHTRGSGYLEDMSKYNNAALRGYRLFRCTPQKLCNPETIELVKKALEAA